MDDQALLQRIFYGALWPWLLLALGVGLVAGRRRGMAFGSSP